MTNLSRNQREANSPETNARSRPGSGEMLLHYSEPTVDLVAFRTRSLPTKERESLPPTGVYYVHVSEHHGRSRHARNCREIVSPPFSLRACVRARVHHRARACFTCQHGNAGLGDAAAATTQS